MAKYSHWWIGSEPHPSAFPETLFHLFKKIKHCTRRKGSKTWVWSLSQADHVLYSQKKKKWRLSISYRQHFHFIKIRPHWLPTVNELTFKIDSVSECSDKLKRLLHVYRPINSTFKSHCNHRFYMYIILLVITELKTYLDKDHSWREIRPKRPIHRRHGPWLSIAEYGLNVIFDCLRTAMQVC